MWLHHAADGRILGDGGFTPGRHIFDPGRFAAFIR